MSALVVEDFELLRDYVEDWDQLARASLEQNPFYESWMLMPALRSFARGRDVRVVLIFASQQGETILCGLFPLEKHSRYKGIPVSAFSLWRHIYCPLCTPLIRVGYASDCVDAFLDWLATADGCGLIELNLISGDGPVCRAIDDRLTARGQRSLICESYERAIFRPAENAEQYVRAALRRERRKDIRRKARLLSERGRVEYSSLDAGGDVDSWTKEFLELEASGWKGKDGGAFACNEVGREFLVTVTRSAFERGRLMMLALRLEGRPVAMKFNILCEPGSFAFKIAFDENYSIYSPGVLLEFENIRRLHDERRVEWMDSCAAADHPMIDRLWPDRTTIQSLLVTTGKRSGHVVVAALPFMRSLNRTFRSTGARS